MSTVRRSPTKPRRGRRREAAGDPFRITRPDQLQALGNPTRWKILGRLLVEPASIQELARSLDVAKGTIGHHVRVLQEAGLVRVVETRRVRGVTEKRYARVAGQFRLPEAHEVPAEEAREIATMPLRQAIAEARGATGQDDPSMSLVVRARMSAARAHRFAAMIETLAAEFTDGAPDEGETFGFVAGIYVPDWATTTATDAEE